MEERTAGTGPNGGGRTGRNLPAAIAVGVGLGASVIISVYTIKEIFLLVVVGAVGVGVVEMIRAFETRGIQVPVVPTLLGLAAMQAGAYWGGADLVARHVRGVRVRAADLADVRRRYRWLCP